MSRTVQSHYNSLYAAVLEEIKQNLESCKLLDENIASVLDKMKSASKKNTNSYVNNIATTKRSTTSGYSVFLKQYAVDPELPPQSILMARAKAWKNLSKEEKARYDAMAKSSNTATDNQVSQSSTESVASDEEYTNVSEAGSDVDV